VNRFYFLVLFQFLFAEFISAQVDSNSKRTFRTDSIFEKDTSIRKDSLRSFLLTDSVLRRPQKDSTRQQNNFNFSVQNISWQILQHHPYFGFTSQPLKIQSDIKKFQGKELQFYVLIALLLFYAMLRRVFPKYFNDLFRLFFRTTIKQLQVREQLIQTPLPSLLLNVFFVVSGGLYISFLLEHARLNPIDNFWLMSFYCTLGLSIIYFVKYAGLKLSGWLFNMQEAADSYIFIVFIINKMIGLLLLPFLVLLAFAQGNIYAMSLTLSWIIIVGLILYRFILTYTTVRNQVKVNPFHFFLYFCAFEIAPLLLIYRGLLLFFHITA
jgi:hypothetical protein